jgi:hypothetical protein
MPHVSDFTRPSNQVVLDLINADNSAALTLSVVDLGIPVAAIEGAPRNTSITVTAKAGSGYSGSQTLNYNRLQLSVFAAGKDLTFSIGDATTLVDLIDEINTLLGINLVVDKDFADAAIPPFAGGIPNETVQVTLTALADSPAYLGSLQINVRSEDIAITDVLTVTELDGLNPPA